VTDTGSAGLPLPTSALATLDWLVIAGYLVLALGAGIFIGRKSRGSMENFFLSGRNLPWWLAGTSMVATSFASDTPLVITGWTRESGVAGNWRWWGYIVTTILVVVLFSRFWQRSRVLTDIEFMELRYSGKPARVLRLFKSFYQVLFMHCFVMGWVMLGMTKVLEVVFDLGGAPVLQLGPLGLTSADLVMLGCCLLALVYSEISGLWGVVVTDFVQFVLALAGAVLLMVAVANHFGGFGDMIEAIKASPLAAGKLTSAPDTVGVVFSDPSTWNREFWQFVVFVGVIWFATKNADGSGVMVQRLLASKNERHAVGASLWYAVAHNAVRPWPWILVALASLLVLPPLKVASPVAGDVVEVTEQVVVVKDGNGALHRVVIPPTGVEDWAAVAVVKMGAEVKEAQLVASTDGELAYPTMMRRFLAPGLLGLMVASFLAAFMSTIDTHVNLASSYLVNDFYRRFVRPDEDPKHYVRVARITGPSVLLVAVVFGLASDSVRGMFDDFSALFSGVGVVYILRWLWWRINAWSEVTALLVGAVVTWTLKVSPHLAVAVLPDALIEAGKPVFPGALMIVVACALPLSILVTLLTPPVSREQLQVFHDRVRPLGAWGPLRRADADPSAKTLTSVRILIAWIGGSAFVLACVLLPGDLMLEDGAHAGLWIGVGLGGAAALLLHPSLLSRHASGQS
jgi:SSS family solute:Na+ symporter